MNKLKLIIVLLCLSAISMNAQTVTAKFGKGIKFVAADTSFSIKFRYRQQQLFESTFSEQANGDFDTESNFQVRRSRLKFSGHAFTPKLTYKAELGLTNRDISVNNEGGNGRGASRVILDAVLKYQFTKHWAIWVGQTKLPGNRERVVSSANLQFVNRSLLNSNFNIDRDAGFHLRGKYNIGNTILKPTVAITKGEGRNITADNFGGYDYTAHVDFLPFGKFYGKKGDYVTSDLERSQTGKLSIGLTFDYNDRAARRGGQLGPFITLTDSAGNDFAAENSLTTFIIDFVYKYKGLSVTSEYANKSGDNDDVSASYNLGSSLNIQAGYLFKSNWEIAGRFTNVRAADISRLNDINEYTLGVSRYVVGHALKVQSDVSRIDVVGSDLETYRFRMQMEMQF